MDPRIRRLRQMHMIFIIVRATIMLYWLWYMMRVTITRSIQLKERKNDRKKMRIQILTRLTRESDVYYRNGLRMNRHVFNVLCEMLRDIGGLTGNKNMSLQEIVAMFLYTLAHHKKIDQFHFFIRSGESVSRHFNNCLRVVLNLHEHLLANPKPIGEDCEDDKWSCFKNHRKAKGLYGVPFPHYDILAEIYGKDRATGEASESFVLAKQMIDDEMSREFVTIDSEDDIDVEIESGSMQSGSGTSGSSKRKNLKTHVPKGKKQKLKRKYDEVSDLSSSLNTTSMQFGKVFEDMNAHLGAMVEVWGGEEERKKKLDNESNKILEEVLKLEVLSPSDALEVATILMAEEHKLRIFYQASTAMQKQYVKDLIKK